MFVRCVTATLKTDAANRAPDVIQNDILPLLRKQKGFRDEVTLIAPDRSEVLSLSFWDAQEDAETYNRTTYPEVLKTILKFVEGTPEVKTFEVANSTFHKIAAQRA